MSRTVLALLCFLSVTESLNICTGNTFAFLVFRSQLFSMKRSYYLVLNLASAPLFVGVTHPISLIKKSTSRSCVNENADVPRYLHWLPSFKFIVYFHTLQQSSSEKAFAIILPFRHANSNHI